MGNYFSTSYTQIAFVDIIAVFDSSHFLDSALVRLVSLFAVVCYFSAFFSFAQESESNPYVFVNQVASKTFDRMKNEQQQIKKDPEILRVIVEQELLPHVDHTYSALLVLGPQANKMPRDKLVAFIASFKRYLTTTYANSLSYYTNQTVAFEPSRSFDGKGTVSIKALIKEPGRDDIDIVFKVRKNKAKEWKAYDMIAEGISLIQSKRSEFASVIRQQGIDATIKLMDEKSSQPIAPAVQNNT